MRTMSMFALVAALAAACGGRTSISQTNADAVAADQMKAESYDGAFTLGPDDADVLAAARRAALNAILADQRAHDRRRIFDCGFTVSAEALVRWFCDDSGGLSVDQRANGRFTLDPSAEAN